jgi:hypothetical protein
MNEEADKRCAQCWQFHAISKFVGARGGIVTWCASCREKYRGRGKGTWKDRSLADRASVRGSRVDSELQNRVTFNPRSGNMKTGPIPVSISEPATCPPSCSFYNAGCYASYGKLGAHWRRVSERGVSWSSLCERIRALKPGQLWRHNEAGDLPGKGEDIDADMLDELVIANAGRRGFTFTHKPVIACERNADLVRKANDAGFTINLSADSLDQADALMALKIGPVSVVLSEDAPRRFRTLAGHTVVTCPAQTHSITCMTCELCSKSHRKSIVGFRAHGQFKAFVTELVRSRRDVATRIK